MENKTQSNKKTSSKERNQEEDAYEYDVQQLSRMPGHCPVSKCSEIVFPSHLMMHMLQKHAVSRGCVSSEMYDHRPLAFSFDPSHFKFGENYCVATLMYGGVRGRPHTQPGLSFMSLPNSALINDNHKYDNYLPIMLMACRTTWCAHMKNKLVERELVAKNANRGGIYVFWLVSPNITRKLYYTLTIHDRHYISSRSVIRVVRNYTHFQNPSDFLIDDTNYLLMCESEIVEFMSISKDAVDTLGIQQGTGIPMELILYQIPLDNVHRNSQKELQAALKHARSLYSKHIMPRTKGSVNRDVLGRLSLTKKPRSNTTSRSSNKCF